MAAKDDKFYVDLVAQIMDGFAQFEWRGITIYIKHHHFREQSNMQRLFERYKQEAIKEGVPTEEHAIKEAIERGDWNEEDEKEVVDAEGRIRALTQAAQQLKVPSQKEAQMQIVASEREKIREKRRERKNLLVFTAESMAYKRVNDEFMDEILFLDAEFTRPFVDSDDYSDDEYYEVADVQLNIYNNYSDENISRAVLRPFFSPFMPFAESPMDFYGIPAIKMTVFQLKLISFARMFFNIFKNVDDIPNIIREDPEAILQFIESKDQQQGSRPQKSGNRDMVEVGSARTYFGANKDDINKIKEGDERVVTLSSQLKKHGGSMNMQQMIEMLGDDK